MELSNSQNDHFIVIEEEQNKAHLDREKQKSTETAAAVNPTKAAALETWQKSIKGDEHMFNELDELDKRKWFIFLYEVPRSSHKQEVGWQEIYWGLRVCTRGKGGGKHPRLGTAELPNWSYKLS